MKKILIVIADYYQNISSGLLKSAQSSLPKKCVIKIIKVPGVFEIPVTISKNLKRYDAFIALGCVIKGQTPHFDFISQASTNAIMNLSVISKKTNRKWNFNMFEYETSKSTKKKGIEAANAVISILLQK